MFIDGRAETWISEPNHRDYLTAPGGAPPMHTHVGEESHVLLEGKILYALGDEVITMDAPYIVNIPPMVPHSFKNLGDEVAELCSDLSNKRMGVRRPGFLSFQESSRKCTAEAKQRQIRPLVSRRFYELIFISSDFS